MRNRQRRQKTRSLFMFSLVPGVLVISIIYFWGQNLLPGLKLNLTLGFYNQIVECVFPQLVYMESGNENRAWADFTQTMLPAYAYHSKQLWYEAGNGEELSQLAAAEEENYQARQEQVLAENNKAKKNLKGDLNSEEGDSDGGDKTGSESGAENGNGSGSDGSAGEGTVSGNVGSAENDGSSSEKSGQESQTQETSKNLSANSLGLVKQVEINRTKLQDFDYLRQKFYQIDSSTTIGSSQLNVETLLGKDMTITKQGEDPVILIYHTHSQEGYADSVSGDLSTTVVGVGDYLTELLTEKYGFTVLHHRGCYDIGDRDHAYSNAAPAIKEILEEYPSIQVVIDLHRDGVPESTHLTTEINGKKMAQIMFFNGLSRTTTAGELKNLPNQYLEDNLAFSFQMQLAATEYYPGLTRRIYLKGYRYNMHFCPKSMLVEVGAQNNTLQEAKNAMEPLADILALVLTGADQ